MNPKSWDWGKVKRGSESTLLFCIAVESFAGAAGYGRYAWWTLPCAVVTGGFITWKCRNRWS